MRNKTAEHDTARLVSESARGYKVHYGVFEEYQQFGLHFHDCYEVLIHVRNGPYYYAGQQVFVPQPYEVFVYPPYQIHGMMGQEPLHCYERMYIHISCQLLDHLGFDQVPVRRILNQYCHSHGSRVILSRQEFAHLLSLSGHISPENPDQSPYSRMIDLAYLSGMFSHICQALTSVEQPSAAQETTPHKTLVHRACCYINGHFTQEITLDTLAEHFGVSKYHLSHKFSEAFGMSVYHYVLMCRITLAQKLITKGRSFQQIATECGFKDYSNFLRAFTKLTGVSPSAWRKQHENQPT